MTRRWNKPQSLYKQLMELAEWLEGEVNRWDWADWPDEADKYNTWAEKVRNVAERMKELEEIKMHHAGYATLLSPLTLEDVERTCEAAFKALPSTTDPSHFAAIRAYWLDVMDRLRQRLAE